jgi:PAS domain S-box-containing protein
MDELARSNMDAKNLPLMPKPAIPPAIGANRPRRATIGRRNRRIQTGHDPVMAELYQRAKVRLRDQQKHNQSKARASESGPARLLHELEVHQIELEMQNAELQKARNELEVALENYTDLYDFAPVGYFSVDESGVILEANLTSAAMLGIERSRLIQRRLPLLISAPSRPGFQDFLKKVFSGPTNQACEALLQKEGGGTFWAGFRAVSAVSLEGTGKWCRITFGDITARKQAEEAQRRVEALALANRKLQHEIVRRRTVEEALKQVAQHERQLLQQSRQLQEQQRLLSHRVLQAQEDERKRISRDLHDVIAQTLTVINVHLAGLKIAATRNPKGLEKSIGRTQRLVERSMTIVHEFARELRPTVLDDLGLIPALNTFIEHFQSKTGIRVHVSAGQAAAQVDGDKRAVFYRVAQEALTNIARHAKARRADVKIQKLARAVCMTITDNGKGFKPELLLHKRKEQRLGLLGMRERVQMVMGSFTIESKPGKGTTVRVQIPLTEVRGGDSKRGPAHAKV